MSVEGMFCSCLEKIFPDESAGGTAGFRAASALRGERFSLQFAFRCSGYYSTPVVFEVDSPLKKYIRVRRVALVPVHYPGPVNEDDEFLRNGLPGLYPDPLMDFDTEKGFKVASNVWHALWIDIDIPQRMKAGKYSLKVTCRQPGVEEPGASDTFTLKVIDAVLPPQKLIHTEWFHADCLATYYNIPVWSEEHWRIIENHFRSATSHGINMLLTPVFTPPLDTQVGGERPTVQLVGVTLKDKKYHFDFTLLTRWIELAQQCGYQYFEISHLFTQWGAKFCPKIMAKVNGKRKRIFGWDVRSDSKKYRDFLDAFLPALTAYLKKKGLQDRVYFHCSDEPGKDHMEAYGKAVEILRKHLQGFKMCDALSSVDFYKTGLVQTPVPAENHIEDFVDAGVKPLWTYYCCSQVWKVPNRLLYMPGARNRILGMLLYRYDVTGFLQWGFNFYYSQFSIKPMDPWFSTDSDQGFPAGDAFMVYPGDKGEAVESMKLEVLFQGLQDLRALQLLATKMEPRRIVAMLDAASPGKRMTMMEYPRSAKELLAMREKINERIRQRFAKRGSTR